MVLYDKIGNFKPANRIFLSPMLEPNDIVFRTLCKRAGASVVYTGMVSPLTHQEVILDDKPAIQIFANSTEKIKEFVSKYDDKVVLWDLNLGCPSTLAGKMGFGSFLQAKPEVIEEILKVMRESTKKPITLKLRKSEHTLKIVKLAEKYADAVCIHARTQAQGYSGLPDTEFAEEVKNSIKLPVIYSGNVTKKNLKEILEKFDFVMIGREAIGNPSIFAELLGEKKKKIDFKDYLELAEKYNLQFKQIKYHAMGFTKSKKGASEMREKISTAKDVDGLKSIFGIV